MPKDVPYTFKHFVCANSFKHYVHWDVGAIYYSQFTVIKLRHNDIQLLAQDQIGSKW